MLDIVTNPVRVRKITYQCVFFRNRHKRSRAYLQILYCDLVHFKEYTKATGRAVKQVG